MGNRQTFFLKIIKFTIKISPKKIFKNFHALAAKTRALENRKNAFFLQGGGSYSKISARACKCARAKIFGQTNLDIGVCAGKNLGARARVQF